MRLTATNGHEFRIWWTSTAALAYEYFCLKIGDPDMCEELWDDFTAELGRLVVTHAAYRAFRDGTDSDRAEVIDYWVREGGFVGYGVMRRAA